MMSHGPKQQVAKMPIYFGGSEMSCDVRRSGDATDARAVGPISAEVLSPDQSLLQALLAAESFDSSGFYKTGRERLTPTLEIAYGLSFELKNGGYAAILLAIDRLSSERKRKISAAKIELIALELTAKPQNVAERKHCSSHASILKVARDEGVSKEQFAEWFRGKKIKDCRSRAARQSCAGTEQNCTDAVMASQPSVRPILRIVIEGLPTPSLEHRMPLSERALAAINSLFETAHAGMDFSKFLDELADAMDVGNCSPAFSRGRQIYRDPIEPGAMELRIAQAKSMALVLRGPPSEREV